MSDKPVALTVHFMDADVIEAYGLNKEPIPVISVDPATLVSLMMLGATYGSAHPDGYEAFEKVTALTKKIFDDPTNGEHHIKQALQESDQAAPSTLSDGPK